MSSKGAAYLMANYRGKVPFGWSIEGYLSPWLMLKCRSYVRVAQPIMPKTKAFPRETA